MTSNAGNSRNAPVRDYSLLGSKEDRILGAFNGISIIVTTYACGIIPEIQVFFELSTCDEPGCCSDIVTDGILFWGRLFRRLWLLR